MSPFHPKSPAQRVEPREQTFTTANGVKIVVANDPPREPKRRQKPPEPPRTQAVILPANQSPEERASFERSLYTQFGQLILDAIRRQGGVQPASAEDVRQRVVLVLLAEIDKGKPIENAEGMITRIVEYEVKNHKRHRRLPPVPPEDADLMGSGDRDPEGMAEVRERLQNVQRYLQQLSPEEREAVLACDVYEQKIEDAAAMFKLPPGTVATHLRRGREKIRALEAESERATQLGKRRTK